MVQLGELQSSLPSSRNGAGEADSQNPRACQQDYLVQENKQSSALTVFGERYENGLFSTVKHEFKPINVPTT